MRPSQHLSTKVRSSFTLNAAWRHVYARAKNSSDDRTKADAALFSENETRHLRELQAELRSKRYKFSPQHGYAKNRGRDKRPRPIVVATVKDRVVQRAILDVCQSTNKSTAKKLGRIPEILRTRTSVGGIPKKGAIDATNLIRNAIAGGAKWFLRTDIKDFFTRISKQSIQQFLTENIRDEEFVTLFMGALSVELANEDEVRDLLDLFPNKEIGVAQGSALSALCANIVLNELDEACNGRGVTTVRYLDDILVLGPNKASVEKVWIQIKSILGSLKMEAHDPSRRSGKADMGRVEGGFDFLSLTFQGTEIFPSRESRANLLNSIRHEITKTKRQIVQTKETPRRAQRHFAQSLALLDLKIRGWGDAFSVTTKRVLFAKLNEDITTLIDTYLSWYLIKTSKVSPLQRRRMLGVTALVDVPKNEPLKL